MGTRARCKTLRSESVGFALAITYVARAFAFVACFFFGLAKPSHKNGSEHYLDPTEYDPKFCSAKHLN